MTMRFKTKLNLQKLANAICENYEVHKIINSNEFLEIALEEANELNIDLNEQTITKYEKELKIMSKCVDDGKSSSSEQPIEYNAEKPIFTKKLVMTINYYDDGSYEKIKPVTTIDSSENPKWRVPNWSWFVEGPDGLVYVKGEFKGQLAGCGGHFINRAGYKISEYQYSLYWIDLTSKGASDLNEDDIEVFKKIRDGRI